MASTQEARGDQADSGEAEESEFEGGQNGQCDGGVEISVNIPGAEDVVLDGGFAIPTFVGVLRVVHPRGLVGEIGAEMDGVQGEERGDGGQPEPVEIGPDWVRPLHELRRTLFGT